MSEGTHLTSDNNGNNAGAPLPPEFAEEIMECLLDYYVSLHKVVKSKITHAGTATKIKIEQIQKTDQSRTEPETAKRVRQYEELEMLWNKLLAILARPGITTETLEALNESEKDIMPPAIRAYYQKLVEMDDELTALIEKVGSEDYKNLYRRAKSLTQKIQRHEDPLSHLPPSEFEGHIKALETLPEELAPYARRQVPPQKQTLQKQTPPKKQRERVQHVPKPKPKKARPPETGMLTLPNGKKVKVL